MYYSDGRTTTHIYPSLGLRSADECFILKLGSQKPLCRQLHMSDWWVQGLWVVIFLEYSVSVSWLSNHSWVVHSRSLTSMNFQVSPVLTLQGLKRTPLSQECVLTGLWGLSFSFLYWPLERVFYSLLQMKTETKVLFAWVGLPWWNWIRWD